MKKIVLCFWLFLALGFTNKAVGQFAGGSGTETDPYQISTPDHLVQLFYYLGNSNVHFKMINNIDLTNYLAVGGAGHNDGAGWNPIGNASNKFSGTFNGADFKISGLWINRSNADYIGLFGHSNGRIINLGVEIATDGVKGGDKVGGLVGCQNNGSIDKCHVIGTISSYHIVGYVGGLVGEHEKGIVSNCYTEGKIVNNEWWAGGLVGSCNSSTITDCYSKCSVNGSNVGGLIGVATMSTILNSYTTGNVSGDGITGGLVGIVYGGVISIGGKILNCHTTGDINGKSNVGGLVGGVCNSAIINSYAEGNVSGTSNCVGGLTGYLSSINAAWCGNNLEKCYATGNINGNESVGGLVGYVRYQDAGTISNCYATKGSVSGNNEVGGLIGRSYGIVNNCYATVTVNGNTDVGGFIGINGRTVNNSFFDYQTSGQIYAVGSGSGTVNNLIGKSTAEMKTKSTFTSAGWDFTTVWGINEGVTYPFFINNPVGINEPIQNINVQLYPNPTNAQLNIESGEMRIRSVEIFDVFGKKILVYSENFVSQNVINISHLSAGVYFVKVNTEEGEVINKVLKE